MAKLGVSVTLLVFCLGMRAAMGEDLFEKMFTFPAETKTAHVRVSSESTWTSINAATVCLCFSDSQRSYSLFSLAVPDQTNSFILAKNLSNVHCVYVNNHVSHFIGLTSELNQWNSLCATWETATGLAQVWLNSKPTPRKLTSPGYSINGVPSIVLGQEQDSNGGSFDALQSFVGSLTDVYMWDFVLSPKEIQYYMTGVVARPGNVVDWRQITFTRVGAVVEETSVLGQV